MEDVNFEQLKQGGEHSSVSVRVNHVRGVADECRNGFHSMKRRTLRPMETSKGWNK